MQKPAGLHHPLPEDTYLNPTDGLIYCKKCNTPREGEYDLMGYTRKHGLLCRCQREQRNRDDETRRLRDHKELVERLSLTGFQDKYLRGCTFENGKELGNPKMDVALSYVKHWEELIHSDTNGLLIWGSVGNGKTFLAACIANALIEREVPVRMVSCPYMLNEIRGKYPGDRNIYISGLDAFSLLILDDLGSENGSEANLELLYQIIDSRYRSKKPLILTTNLTLDELKEPTDLIHRRTYSRILEMCVSTFVDGPNIREQSLPAKMKRVKDLLRS